MYAKTENVMNSLYKFTIKQWKFDSKNTRELWSSLNQEDQKTFWFSLENFDWTSYIKFYYYGIREHLLHEDLSNVTKALSKHRKYVPISMLTRKLFFIRSLQITYFIVYFQVILVASVVHFFYIFSYVSIVLDAYKLFNLVNKLPVQ